MTSFFVHQDISKASTLHADFYTSDEVLALTKQKLFANTWQFIGDTDELKENRLVPKTILPDFLDEPILLVQDKNNKLHCLSNVCTHRGNIVVENKCSTKQLVCRYHGRRFDLDGTFKQMPEFEGVENFPSKKDNLSKVPFHILEKFLFASLHPSVSFESIMNEMQKRMFFFPFSRLQFSALRSRDYTVKAHWALYCENYLEGFHIPFIHNSLNAVLDYSSYTTELFRYSNLQLGVSKEGEDAFDLPKESPDYGKNISAYYFWVFPNMMFNFYPWGLSINIVKPIHKELTTVSFLTYIYDESKLERGAGAMLDKVEMEDEAVVENVQKGIKSTYYTQGRYSPKQETGTHHFHRLICEFLTNN